MENTIYWIWLQLACGPASPLPKKLLESFSYDINAIYNADYNDYKTLDLPNAKIKPLIDKSTDEAQKIIDWCNEKKVGILCYDNPLFPNRLQSISDPPIVLYYIGKLYNIENSLCIGGVGTRTATRYGRENSYSFCYELARCGTIIVSGLAAGIDTSCHRAALDAGGKTIAVIGCRIDKVYPPENRNIMREIARNGLLITEYHPFFNTTPKSFPQRNRIISGLCQGIIVFEADTRSGSLITARLAQRQGRTVYALPGRIGETTSLGTNSLIRNGASLISRPSDIIDEYRFFYNLEGSSRWIPEYSGIKPKSDSYHKINTKRKNAVIEETQENRVQFKETDEVEPPVTITDELQLKIYELLNKTEPIAVETIDISGYSLADIMSALTMLELTGLIEQHPGNTYTKKY